jgi:hypothetical protein
MIPYMGDINNTSGEQKAVLQCDGNTTHLFVGVIHQQF